MSEESIEMLQTAYEGYARRSVEESRHLFADGFRFHMRPEFPVQGSYGVDDIGELWAELDETFSDYQLRPTRFELMREHVLVTLEASSKFRGTDARVSDEICHLWHVHDGKIREAWTYRSRDEALEAVAARMPD